MNGSTKEGQTPNTGWDTGGKRDIMNDFFYASLSSGKIDVVVNVRDAVADPADNHYWMTNGTAELYNADSTHLDNTGNAACAPVLRAALLSLSVDTNALTYSQWTNQITWGAADSAPGADPNSDGLSNVEAYAHDLSPLDTASAGDRPSFAVDNIEHQRAVDGVHLPPQCDGGRYVVSLLHQRRPDEQPLAVALC